MAFGSKSLQNVSNSYHTHIFWYVKILMSNYADTNSVASFWVRYFILLVFILEMYEITIPTSHVKLYFGRADLMLKIPFINLVMTGCWPTGTVLITLYPTPLWNKSYKNNKFDLYLFHRTKVPFIPKLHPSGNIDIIFPTRPWSPWLDINVCTFAHFHFPVLASISWHIKNHQSCFWKVWNRLSPIWQS